MISALTIYSFAPADLARALDRFGTVHAGERCFSCLSIASTSRRNLSGGCGMRGGERRLFPASGGERFFLLRVIY